jgi:N6-L-threonylcarbamoyladenine synthase
MTILALESSCDETAAAVVQDGHDVLSSVIASQHEIHEEYAGVVPELASRAHVERMLPTVRTALEAAGVGLGMIDAIAVGHRPGLIGSLLIGVSAAKAMAWSLAKPLIGVDHVHAHLYAGVLHQRSDVPLRHAQSQPPDLAPALFPALGLIVSGGHTSMYLLRSWTDLTRLGATIDDAMGEAFDKAATILGIPYPGGPNLDRLASAPGANERIIDLPISRLSTTSLDFSFSGLKTALLYAVRGLPGPRGEFARDASHLTPEQRRDYAAAFQRAACQAGVLKVERVLDRWSEFENQPCRTILTGGGVTANSRLRADLQSLAQRRGLSLRLPPLEWCVDNAAMIGGLAFELHRAGRASGLALQAVPTTSLETP